MFSQAIVGMTPQDAAYLNQSILKCVSAVFHVAREISLLSILHDETWQSIRLWEPYT